MYSFGFTVLYRDLESMSVAWFIKPCLTLPCNVSYGRKQINLFDGIYKNW